MYDIHCHLLPAIDDGSPSLEYSLDMARFAAAHGTTHMVLTPHIHCGRYDNDSATIHSAFRLFTQAVLEHDIQLKLGMAAEVRLSAEVLGMFEQQRLPFLGEQDGMSILLLEFPHSHVPLGSENFIDWLDLRGCRPLIAHPERNKEIMRNPQRLQPLLSRGCLLQVTAGSLAGRFGPAALALAEQLLLEGKIDVIASDSHNLNHRTPDLTEGYEHARELVGDQQARKLVVDNPRRIVAAQFA
ncbi:MAG: capsular biosynthesis protein [Gammaproteobacteria bacterium]|nr:capsular biosynthesis protein [Gammaproteobacteria bacterium]